MAHRKKVAQTTKTLVIGDSSRNYVAGSSAISAGRLMVVKNSLLTLAHSVSFLENRFTNYPSPVQ
jgi:hypothetical protein